MPVQTTVDDTRTHLHFAEWLVVNHISLYLRYYKLPYKVGLGRSSLYRELTNGNQSPNWGPHSCQSKLSESFLPPKSSKLLKLLLEMMVLSALVHSRQCPELISLLSSDHFEHARFMTSLALSRLKNESGMADSRIS